MLNYGIDANVLTPPWSFLASILLIIGVTALGFWILNFLTKASFLRIESSMERFFYGIIIGAGVLGATIYPALLYSSNASIWLKYLSFTILILGTISSIYFVFLISNTYSIFNYPENWHRLLKIRPASLVDFPALLIILIFNFFLMSAGPATDGDELNYHIGVPLEILATGSWIYSPEWFHSRLAGMGEALITLGLVIGAEQFGSLLQFGGFISIVIILISENKKKSNTRFLYPIVFSCSPVVLWLISSSKPFMLPLAMTTLSLRLLIPIARENKINRKVLLTHFSIAIFLLSSATQMKFNFMLSGFLVGALWLYFMHRQKNLFFALLIAFTCSAMIMLPQSIWKYIKYGEDWYQGIYRIFPGNLAGYDNFHYFLTHWREASYIPFPINIFITEVPGQAATVIGIGVLVWFLAMPKLLLNYKTDFVSSSIAMVSLCLAILGAILGQVGGRFYLEPLVWLLLALATQNTAPLPIFSSSIFTFITKTQAILVIAASIYCSSLLFPGALNGEWRMALLNKIAFQHADVEWISQNTSIDDVVLTEIRPLALLPRKTISLDWASFVNPRNREALLYLEQIKKKSATHIITFSDPKVGEWAHCLKGKIVGPYNSMSATRNPFNRGNPYSIWLAEFDSEALPQCMIEDNSKPRSKEQVIGNAPSKN